jgi:peptidoglycan/LPS O-acetylase OafA/YrhL
LGVIFVGTNAEGRIDFVAPFLFTLTVAVFAREAGFLSKLLRKAAHLGTISYSIYLNQIAVAILFGAYVEGPLNINNEWLSAACYLAILILYSHITYVLVEQPARVWGRGLVRPRAMPAEVKPAAVS